MLFSKTWAHDLIFRWLYVFHSRIHMHVEFEVLRHMIHIFIWFQYGELCNNFWSARNFSRIMAFSHIHPPRPHLIPNHCRRRRYYQLALTFSNYNAQRNCRKLLTIFNTMWITSLLELIQFTRCIMLIYAKRNKTKQHKRNRNTWKRITINVIIMLFVFNIIMEYEWDFSFCEFICVSRFRWLFSNEEKIVLVIQMHKVCEKMLRDILHKIKSFVLSIWLKKNNKQQNVRDCGCGSVNTIEVEARSS